jgi:hypothetical protein
LHPTYRHPSFSFDRILARDGKGAAKPYGSPYIPRVS